MDDRVTSSTYDLLKPFPDEAVAASTWRSAAGTAPSTEKVGNHTEGNGTRQRGGMRELPTADSTPTVDFWADLGTVPEAASPGSVRNAAPGLRERDPALAQGGRSPRHRRCGLRDPAYLTG